MKVGITGHQNIPRRAIDFVTKKILQLLEDQSAPIICVTSLAEGADQLCAALVLKRGGSLHAVVPCAHYEKNFATVRAAKQFKAFVAEAANVETLPFCKPSEAAFLAAGCRVVDLSDVLIAVWDGGPARGTGGTADIVAYARRRKVPVSVIWPQGLSR
jgi:hypothetical protein